ncbi:MAG: hypothetical protein A2667_00185 [Candidatus Wildermuthbacteria bacterium RIFCSPHIGHO2_01_FULL_47_27]|uniref:Cell division protein FtsL n=2 Tax=Candidatus Wildermuthiibacteriota TaxID=1817923 RepID=A0A1G2RP38_9BACT|nr:MAG: hypothetical protein UY15_C0001G0062 [Parcubacteria group bacterium GW2011_GWA2_47_9]OHA63699.1 MAG: hypothetical protein A2667_00185 [Candidatus Wildermuthbacteria bacterium RIFCSPHIGHO2_01_FULL_47_27]OHA68066.1 MAG: hypothetical protein A3D59_04235 [Candidatus Wildermuthbacteria bacterium RIFCSPHIGHO2_02_FULL_47_17]OHA74635.1 MAG: hypothetical protein A3A32_01950 [Candidatus Wildermuthbacteria bacterium RIFCSPLOWO2_01_FULL_48_35]
MFIAIPLNGKNTALISSLFIFALLGVYLWQVNLIVRQSALRDSAAKKIQELSLQNKGLEIELSRADSLDQLAERLSGLSSFENVSRVKYLRLLGGVVVRSSENSAP